jgi:anti-sigma factor RsiW
VTVRLALRWRREIVCRDAVSLVTDYLEGALSPAMAARFERHLASCDGCEEYLREMRISIQLTNRLEPEEVPEHVLDGLVAVLLAYRAEGGSDGASDGASEGGSDGASDGA